MAALFAFVGSAMILGGIDSGTAFSDAPTHLSKFIPHLAFVGFGLSVLGALTPGMAFNSPILTSLTTWTGKHSKMLLGQLYQRLETSDITIDTDASADKLYPKLSVSGGIVAYTGTFSATDDLTFSDKKLSPKLAKRELQIEPKKFFNTYLQYIAGLTRNGALDTQIPFEAFIMQKVMEQMAQQVNNKIIGLGDTASADATKAITDGFLKLLAGLITATEVTPVATGAWTSANAVTKAETLWKGIPDTWKGINTILYVSRTQYQNILESYRALYPTDAAAFRMANQENLFIPISGGMCTIKPQAWMGTSNRAIITVPENLIVGGNPESDMAGVKVIEDVWVKKLGVAFSIGMLIPDSEAIFCNDQA